LKACRNCSVGSGQSKAPEVVVDTADGERVIVWHVPPHEDSPYSSISTAMVVRCAGGMNAFARS
jgi:hypothetical protein